MDFTNLMSKNTILSEIPNVDGIIKNVNLSGFETALPNVDYQLPIEEQKIKLGKEKTEKSYNQSIDIISIITSFRNMSDEEKQSIKIKMMYEIEYIILNLIHHQLLYGLSDNSVKGIIPKEDINAFKIIKEIMSKPDIQSEQVKLNDINNNFNRLLGK
jgi:hypothetical protein